MNYMKKILQGVIIGIANVIPGVSGGTLALSMGAYNQIIEAVTHIFKNTKQSIITLLPYGAGALIGIACLSFTIEYLFIRYPIQTGMTFIGLIAGGVPALMEKMKGMRIGISGRLSFEIVFVIMVIIAFYGSASERSVNITASPLSMVCLFLAGILAASTMVIPGVSGSMLLMILGYYQPLLHSINSFIKSAAIFNIYKMINDAVVLMPFGLGMLAGTFLCARLVEFLFKRYEMITRCGIMGLVASSPIVILASSNISEISLSAAAAGIICCGTGFLAATLFK